MCNGRIYNDVGGGNEIKIDISPLTQITGGMRFQVLVTTDKTNNNLSFNVNNSDQTIQTMPIYDKTIYRNIPVGSIPNPSILEFVCYPILIEDDTIAGMILLDISTQDLYLKDKQIHNLANGTNPTDAVNLGQLNACLPLDGSRGMTGNLNLNNHQIKAVANASNPTDAVNLGQLNTGVNTCLPLDGSRNMTGNLNLNDKQIRNLANATIPTDAVNLGQLNTCLPLDGTNSMTGNLNLNNHQIRNLANGTNPTDAVNLGQQTAAIDTCLPLDGNNSMTGNLNLNNHQIHNLANGTIPTDAVNLGQLMNTGVNTCLPLDGSRSMTGNLNLNNHQIKAVATGTDLTDAVNLSQQTAAINTCLPLDGTRGMTDNLNLNNHQIKAVATGTDRYDAVNLEQLKGSSNYYIATQVLQNVASINISPLTNINSSFTCYVVFTFSNIASMYIRVIGANNVNLGDIEVVTSGARTLTGGEILLDSIKQLVYAIRNGTPYFILMNPELGFTNFALKDFSNVNSNIRYINETRNANVGVSTVVTGMKFNDNTCMHWGTYDFSKTDGYIKSIQLPYEYKYTYFTKIATISPRNGSQCYEVASNNIRVHACEDSGGNTSILYFMITPSNWANYISDTFLIISWSTMGFLK